MLTSLSRSRVPGVTVREQAWLYFMRTRVSFLLIHGDSINVWWREYYQRGYSTRVIADDYHGKRYFVVVTDADEIPSMRYVLPVRLRRVFPFGARYNMKSLGVFASISIGVIRVVILPALTAGSLIAASVSRSN